MVRLRDEDGTLVQTLKASKPHTLERLEHLGRLAAVRARADAELVGGRRNLELVEKNLRKSKVVMLTGMDDTIGDVRTSQGRRQNGRFDELRPRPDYA